VLAHCPNSAASTIPLMPARPGTGDCREDDNVSFTPHPRNTALRSRVWWQYSGLLLILVPIVLKTYTELHVHPTALSADPLLVVAERHQEREKRDDVVNSR